VLDIDIVAYRVTHVERELDLELVQTHYILSPLWMDPFLAA
jgi:hypothetical protein